MPSAVIRPTASRSIFGHRLKCWQAARFAAAFTHAAVMDAGGKTVHVWGYAVRREWRNGSSEHGRRWPCSRYGGMAVRVKWFVPGNEESFKPFGIDCDGAAGDTRCGEPALSGHGGDTALPTSFPRNRRTRSTSFDRPVPGRGLCQPLGQDGTRR